MLNNWEDFSRSGFQYFERHHPEAKALYKGEFKDKKPSGRGSLYMYKSNDTYIGGKNMQLKYFFK